MSDNDTASDTSARGTERERIIEMLSRDDGVKIPEIAEDQNKPREEIREALRELNAEYELGSSSDFRYRILGERDRDD